ncbi:putative opsin protein [Diaporthe ampelina]|uniref:Putative opsin protein n=1 Tax=Diaporthe ampelina TaxID=1214573 RepID=A0A0G2I1Q8_9PEZI|nr:putative opsin protein [Diaporthe ampelina]
MQNILDIDPIPTVKPDPTQYEVAGDTGFSTLWVVFVIMLVASGFFTLLSWNIPVSKRLYHVITTLITITAALSYFSMATGHGANLHCVQVKTHHNKVPDTYHDVCREVYFARYIDWAITTPLLLADLCLLAGIDGAHTIMAIVADLIMILTGLFAAYGSEKTAQKWGWYAIACIAYIFVVWHVALHGTNTVKARGNKVTKLFGSLALFTFILWTAYPIVWGFADGARKASVDSEILAYAVLDILAKPIFGLWLLISHRSIPETNVEIGGYWAHGLSNEGRIRIGDDEN